jgi:hypothetical protein
VAREAKPAAKLRSALPQQKNQPHLNGFSRAISETEGKRHDSSSQNDMAASQNEKVLLIKFP